VSELSGKGTRQDRKDGDMKTQEQIKYEQDLDEALKSGDKKKAHEIIRKHLGIGRQKVII
jgi:DNA-binding GntR family transcriptional regulator